MSLQAPNHTSDRRNHLVTTLLLLSGVFAFHFIDGNAEPAASWVSPQSGWLYVLDIGNGASKPQILLVDPAAGAIRASLEIGEVGFNPEIALSRDGRRLYLLQISEQEKGLLVVDTSTGSILQAVSTPPKLQYILFPHAPSLVLPPDGNRLYMVTMRSLTRSSINDVYSIATFDTTHGIFLPGRAAIPNCGPPIMLPHKAELQLDVLCSETNSLHHLTLSADGSLGKSKTAAVSSSPRGVAHLMWGDKVRTAAALSDSELVIFKGDGRIFRERASNGTLEDVGRLQGLWISPRPTVFSPDHSKIFIAAAAEPGGGSADRILVLDSSLRVVETIRTSRPFWSLTSDPAGLYLYAPTTTDGSVLVIDISLGRDIREITGLGRAPSQIIVAP